MKTICFDPVGGAAGDMILAALFDLGAPVEAVDHAVRSTGLEEFELHFERRQDENGIVCGFCDVRTHDRHDHGPGHGHGHDGHHGRHLAEILAMIDSATFAARVKGRAAAVFRRLADAEAAVHGIAPEEVHFHEVGAVDSIVDIVGVCVALECLDVDTVLCSELKLGHGTVTCAHGVLPVPAPATAKLLEGAVVKRLDVSCELTTPTGAALLTTLSEGPWNDVPFSVTRVGAGHGRRVLDDVPNIIRAFLCEDPVSAEMVRLLETDIDDDTPERIAHVADALREAGALDVTVMPVQMKKGRTGLRIGVLAPLGREDAFVRLLLDESSTIGVRSHTVRRYALPRTSGTVDTPWGPVKVKTVTRPAGPESVPEFDDCRRVASDAGVPLRKVMLTATTVDGSGNSG